MSDPVRNPLRSLLDYGQSVWLDYIRRSLITGGELQRLRDEDGLRGVTSNPTIFEKAIAGSTDYKDLLEAPESRALDPKALFEKIAVRDIQDAADLLHPVYEQSRGRDGFVSLEVSPLLAHNTAGTLAEARRLWKAVGRENLMVKVPATREGIPAIEELIGEGININVTLLFSQAAYLQVASAYLAGLEALAARGGEVKRVASVASFFISRIDSAVDALIAKRLEGPVDRAPRTVLTSLVGRVAIANAKVTYQKYQEIFSGPRWQALAARGAQTQRLLWASTGTKNPQYRDVLYVEELIGPDTVDTIPPATFDAFRDHGRLRASLTEDVDAAYATMGTLPAAGISMEEVTDKLLADGVTIFADAFDKLIRAVGKYSQEPGKAKINRQTARLPDPLAAAVRASLEEWGREGKVRRLWARDAALWTGTDEGHWLGWLGITEDQHAHLQDLQKLQEEVRGGAFTHVLLLGMGGSSLCPEVLTKTFGRVTGFPEFHVLDSTDPAQIWAFAARVDIAHTLFIVSSKSGGTLEPNIFKQYFFERAKAAVGDKEVGRRFIAITDPGSQLQQVAEREGFRHIFYGLPSIGGRYSALSAFGMVPAAVMGLEVGKFLDRTEEMVHACAASVPVEENPGVVLGTILGLAAARFGRDKVTIVASPAIGDVGAWLEQLLAESTGKAGKGLIPVDREALGKPEVYGGDRLFAYLRLEAAPDPGQDAMVSALEGAGHPVVRIDVDEVWDLGEEFFRWEVATAVAGSILGINPFNQPDVEASKVATRRLTTEYEEKGSLPGETPLLEEEGIKLFADGRNASALQPPAGARPSLDGYLKAHLSRLGPGDYFALLAYLEMNDSNERALADLRRRVRDAKRVATCLGFGPRFLHSTGQAYKGGPNSGVFLQLTGEDAMDLPVPGQKYTFGVVKAAQARGDLQVLAERERRALRVHLGPDVRAGLARLSAAVDSALV